MDHTGVLGLVDDVAGETGQALTVVFVEGTAGGVRFNALSLSVHVVIGGAFGAHVVDVLGASWTFGSYLTIFVGVKVVPTKAF